MKKSSVAILGATGTVGQKFISLLEGHPDFKIGELVASDARAGKRYGECCEWRESLSKPDWADDFVMCRADEIQSPYVLSSVPAKTASEWEPRLAERGHHVLSNASALRMKREVPLLIPGVNSSHIELVEKQSFSGKIVCNPNCSTVFFAMALAPLLEMTEIEEISVFTMQAVSGAGYPGVPSIDLMGNSLPFISNEEDKIETESQKILGTAAQSADFKVMAHVNRVGVAHGHNVTFHAKCKSALSQEQVQDHYSRLAEERPEDYAFYADPFRPQIRLDLKHDDMRAHIGRIKTDPSRPSVGMLSMGHNLVRGAAGAAIKNMELLREYLGNDK